MEGYLVYKAWAPCFNVIHTHLNLYRLYNRQSPQQHQDQFLILKVITTITIQHFNHATYKHGTGCVNNVIEMDITLLVYISQII